MCTLTYLPLKNNGLILTFSRDESVLRKPALPPETYTLSTTEVCYPKDGEAGGTWIASSKNGFTLALYNGANERYTPGQGSKSTRGQIILDFFNYFDVKKFITEYNFDIYEPFTFIIVHINHQLSLNEIKWDGERMQWLEKDSQTPAIWSSPNLYNENMQKKQLTAFHKWLDTEPLFDMHTVLSFHKGVEKNNYGHDVPEHVKTLSISSIKRTSFLNKMRYEDLLNNRIYMKSIS